MFNNKIYTRAYKTSDLEYVHKGFIFLIRNTLFTYIGDENIHSVSQFQITPTFKLLGEMKSTIRQSKMQ